jgi:hypothetical protein
MISKQAMMSLSKELLLLDSSGGMFSASLPELLGEVFSMELHTTTIEGRC